MDDLDEIELTDEEIDKYIPYRNEIQDILEREELADRHLFQFYRQLRMITDDLQDELSQWMFPYIHVYPFLL